jgi:deoxycytidylate deaminase
MKQKFKHAFMKTAYTFAELSSAVKLKVGAVVVKDDRIISLGYNGTPTGWDNCCERVIYPDENHGDYDCDPEEFAINFPYVRDDNQRYALKTKSEVFDAFPEEREVQNDLLLNWEECEINTEEDIR